VGASFSKPPAPSAVWLTLGILAVVTLVAAAIVLSDWPFVERAIALEDAPIAWLQTSLIAASAVVCLCRAIIHGDRRAGWYVVAAALFALALDERFMGHEQLKEWIWLNVFDGDRARMGHWGDAPVVLYGVGGAAVVLWMMRRGARGYPALLLWAAIAVAGCAIALDVVATSIWSQIWEELLELLAETLFFVSLLLSLAPTLEPEGTRRV
jgi:hypothetical protein